MSDVCSQQELISQYIARYLMWDREEPEQLNPIVRDIITDLIRIKMRQIAASKIENYSQKSGILEEAINRSVTDIRNFTSANNIHFLENYLKIVREELKYTAKEISELQSRLQASRESHEIVEGEGIEPYYSTIFEVTTLGSKDCIQGFWASLKSTNQIIHIDSNYFQNIGQVRGDWFPIEIKIGELYFVIDDDASIYTSTENFPEHLIKNSYKEMEKIVNKICSANET